MVSMLDVDFGNTVEPQLFPVDEEVTVKIIRAEMHESQGGKTSLHLIYKSADTPNMVSMHEYIGQDMDNPDNDPTVADRINANKLKLQRIFKCFGVDLDQRGIDLTDPAKNEFIGLVGTVICFTEQDAKGEFPDKSRVKKYIFDE